VTRDASQEEETMNDKNQDGFEALEAEALAHVSGGKIDVVDKKTGKPLPTCPSPYTEDELTGNGSKKKVMWTICGPTTPKPPVGAPPGTGAGGGR